MIEPGNNTPPSVSAPAVACSPTGVSTVTFNANKVVFGSTLGLLITDDVTQDTVWSNGTTDNSKTFTVTGIPNGAYTLTADNGEGSASQQFTIDCQSTVACDLVASQVQGHAATASTGLGYAEVTIATSFPPVALVLTAGPRLTAQTPAVAGRTLLTSLPPGTYTLRLTDAAGCQQTVTFTIGAAPVPGCMDNTALNYNALATVSDNSCVYPVAAKTGCTNPRARNYDPTATQDDGSCQFGPVTPQNYNYSQPSSTTLVYNEALSKWVTEQTSRPQMLLPLQGRHVHALPLPNQTADAPASRYLWEHNAGPQQYVPAGSSALPGILLYGRRHETWIEVIVLGEGVHTIKNLDNLVLVSNEELPAVLVVSTPEQGQFTQTLVGGRNRLSTVDRKEQLTYVQLNAPHDVNDKAWGGRVRAPYIRLRIKFAGRQQLRLSKLFVLLRESLT